MGSIKNSNLGQAWLVLLLSIVFSVSLTAVHLNLGPVIEENKTKETMEKIPVLVTGNDSAVNADTFDISQRIINADKNGRAKSYIVYDAIDKSGTVAGHVVKASGQGYADKIELLLGLDSEGKTITGLFILDQKETPGLGNKIIEDDWRNQYVGKSSDSSLVVIKGKSVNENEIDAVSGATISSRAVTDIINSTISDVKTKIMLPESGNKMENR
ncbi:MAG: FMN-binding protein [Deltaproteobacteria bacterium]|nr:FMN-binding protein [Deltaproteobacteria bacterium]